MTDVRWRSTGGLRPAQARPARRRTVHWVVCRVSDRSDVHAALGQPLIDHGVDVHEGFDGHPQHPLGQQLPQSLMPAGARTPPGCSTFRCLQVATRADGAPDLADPQVATADCSESRPSSDSLTAACRLSGMASSAMRLANRSGSWSSRPWPIVPISAVGSAMRRCRRAAGSPPSSSAGASRAGGESRHSTRPRSAVPAGPVRRCGEPVHRVHGAAPAGEDGLDGHPRRRRVSRGASDHRADLIVVDPAVAVIVSVVNTSGGRKLLQCSLFEVADIGPDGSATPAPTRRRTAGGPPRARYRRSNAARVIVLGDPKTVAVDRIRTIGRATVRRSDRRAMDTASAPPPESITRRGVPARATAWCRCWRAPARWLPPRRVRARTPQNMGALGLQ